MENGTYNEFKREITDDEFQEIANKGNQNETKNETLVGMQKEA